MGQSILKGNDPNYKIEDPSGLDILEQGHYILQNQFINVTTDEMIPYKTKLKHCTNFKSNKIIISAQVTIISCYKPTVTKACRILYVCNFQDFFCVVLNKDN